jgi:transaldolase
VSDAFAALSACGVSVWLADLSRERLVSGSLADLVADNHVVGVTTDPTIFAKAITAGDAYDALLHDQCVRGVEVDASWDRLREQLSATLRAQPAGQHGS